MFWAISLGEPIGRDLAVVGFIKTTICMIKDEHAIALCDRCISMNMTFYTFSEALSLQLISVLYFLVKSVLLLFCCHVVGVVSDSCQGRMEVCNRWLWVTPCLLPAGCQRG